MGNLKSYPSSPRKKYDVFVNFRGKDTRDCFTSHLDGALRRKQIEAFIDYRLRVGDEILPGLMEAIDESKISVVIFSEDYATSKWCLRELVEILKCKKMNQIVLPVFYRVDPSDVRHQTGSFNDSFVEHEKSSQKEVKTWRDALAEACGIKGWHSSVGSRTDATLVEEIVNDIWKKLMSEYVSPDFGKLVGLERIKQVISLLCLHDRLDFWIIGIWGMGGIGKTTLADAIFNKYSNQFEGVCFIQNVRERLRGIEGLVSLQKEILSKVLKDEDLKLDGPTIPPKIKERLNRIKVFIVLDDVDDFIQMETLVKGVGGLGQGSRIIITSRDKQVLRNCRVSDDNIYEVKGFNYHEALQLFCNYAFDKNCHSEDLMVNQLVNFAKGSPLALKVLGSLLCKKSKQEWESVVNKFKLRNLSHGIFDVLKISYDGLTDIEKDIFLDIACFLKGGKKDYVAKILDECHYSLSVLIDKSLITISCDHTIEMHDLLEEMGKDIVNKECPNKIGKCSRLWRQKDVLCTLTNDDGTPEVQGIVLNMIKINKDIHLSPRAFKEMYNLRLLKFYDSTRSTRSKVNFSEGLSDLSNELRSLIWYGYPLQALPSNFNPNNLVELDLRGSNLERLWDDCTPAPNLRWLDLSGCTHVTKIPSLSKSPLLETINLKDCSSLLDLPQLCMHVPNLRWLDLSGCTRVTKMPYLSKSPLLESIDLRDCSSLLDFPQLCMDAPKLRWLNLYGCTRVTKIPDLSKSPLLELISLRDCNSLLDFPQLAQHLKNLRYLDRSGCNSLRSFPSDIHFESLTSLDLSNCNNLTKFGSQISGNNITSLDLSGTAIKELHHSIGHLNGLTQLFLRRCKNLETLPSGICNLTSLQCLDLSDCSRLEILPENLGNLKSLKYLSAKRAAVKELPHSTAYLNGLTELFLRRCKNLETLPSGICNLTSLLHLDLSDCSRLEILPENLKYLISLKCLSVDRIPISQLPSSMEHLKELKKLSCHGLRFIRSSGLGLPSNLSDLSACDCKQLQSLPNELDFARILNTKLKPKPTEFIFTNCMNLEETAVGNMLARLMKYLHQDYICFSFCYPGSDVPKWFRYTTEGSSIKFQDTLDWKLKGWAVCTVIAFDKYLFNGDSQHKLGVHFDGTGSDGYQSSPTNITSVIAYVTSRNRTLIDSDHVAFGYCDASYHYRHASYHYCHFGTRFKNYSFEFRLSEESPNYRLKSCGVCPIYVQDSDTDDSDEADTSGNRFDVEEFIFKREPFLLGQIAWQTKTTGKPRRPTSNSSDRGRNKAPVVPFEAATQKTDINKAPHPTTTLTQPHPTQSAPEAQQEPHPRENKNLQTVKYAEQIERSGIRRRRTSNDHLEEEVEPQPKRLNI